MGCIITILYRMLMPYHPTSTELQFRALEKSSQIDERCSVMRNGVVERVNPADLVVGDILVLQV